MFIRWSAGRDLKVGLDCQNFAQIFKLRPTIMSHVFYKPTAPSLNLKYGLSAFTGRAILSTDCVPIADAKHTATFVRRLSNDSTLCYFPDSYQLMQKFADSHGRWVHGGLTLCLLLAPERQV